MTPRSLPHAPQSCHWSVPTLLMPKPYWLSASDCPWCCWNDQEIRVLDSTEFCRTCPVWEPRRARLQKTGPVAPEGSVPGPQDS